MWGHRWLAGRGAGRVGGAPATRTARCRRIGITRRPGIKKGGGDHHPGSSRHLRNSVVAKLSDRNIFAGLRWGKMPKEGENSNPVFEIYYGWSVKLKLAKKTKKIFLQKKRVRWVLTTKGGKLGKMGQF